LTNGVSAEIHAAPTLGSMLLARAARSPEALAFADATRQVTFGELAEAASALAGGLTRRGCFRAIASRSFLRPVSDSRAVLDAAAARGRHRGSSPPELVEQMAADLAGMLQEVAPEHRGDRLGHRRLVVGRRDGRRPDDVKTGTRGGIA